jgi:hypothetical protein
MLKCVTLLLSLTIILMQSLTATATGGAIRGQIGSTLAMTNVTIDQCTAGDSGGGLLTVGDFTIVDSSFTSCKGESLCSSLTDAVTS